ncbi:MAG: type II toxin-antitoxin system RelE/ParE family toxin [Rhodospirillales bacterium]
MPVNSRYRISRKAQEDIREIGLYTQKTWGKKQRRNYLNGLEKCFRQITENPSLAPEHPEFEPVVRIHPFQKHLIVYISGPESLLIVRVLHASMDVTTRLSPS